MSASTEVKYNCGLIVDADAATVHNVWQYL